MKCIMLAEVSGADFDSVVDFIEDTHRMRLTDLSCFQM